MQALFIVLLVLFSIGIGLSLGILFFSSGQPFKNKSSDDAPVLEENQDPPEQPRPKNEKDLSNLTEPQPNSKLLLHVWQIEEDQILYGFQGTYATREELPQDILSILEPFQQEEEPGIPHLEKEDIPTTKEFEKAEKEKEVEPLSLSSEIDNILQEKLSESTLNEKGIRLTENAQKEIIIWVGLESYSSIDAIPDVQIQKIIQESVQDWEDSTK
jgi:hypothetical protein